MDSEDQPDPDARLSTPSRDLRSFRLPHDTITHVQLSSDEVTTLDPLSGRPDFVKVKVTYQPKERVLGSRSLRRYFQSLRDERTSIEELAAMICRDINEAIQPNRISVEIKEKPRGGISIRAYAQIVNHEPGNEVMASIIGGLMRTGGPDEEETN